MKIEKKILLDSFFGRKHRGLLFIIKYVFLYAVKLLYK